MPKLKPLHDRIIVKAVSPEETTAGGIILPDTAKQKPQEAEVVAVGPGRILDNGDVVTLEIEPGDRILYAKYGGTEIKFGAEEYIILRHDDILGIMSGVAPGAVAPGAEAELDTSDADGDLPGDPPTGPE